MRPARFDQDTRLAIVVMGVSGSGKSTLGEALAKTLGCSFLEGDAFHSTRNVAKMRAGRPLGDRDRWPWLDRLGTAVAEAIENDGVVVAACSALKRGYRERLVTAAHARVRFVLLDASRDQLTRRLADRPRHYMPASLLDSQLATLERPGADEDAITLDADRPLGALCDEALRWALGTAAARPVP